MKCLTLFVVFLCSMCCYAQTIKTYSSNDSNVDGVVNIADVTNTVNSVIGESSSTSTQDVVTATDLNTLLTTLNNTITSLNTQVTSLQTQVTNLQTQVTALQNKDPFATSTITASTWTGKGACMVPNPDISYYGQTDVTLIFSGTNKVAFSFKGSSTFSYSLTYKYFSNTQKLIFYDSDGYARYVFDVHLFSTKNMVLQLQSGILSGAGDNLIYTLTKK